VLELQRTLFVVRRWWWLLLGAAILGGLAAYVGTKALSHPQFVSTATIAIAPEQSSGGMLAVAADAQLIPTVAHSAAVRRLVHGANVDTATIQGSSSPEGELLSVTVKSRDLGTTPALANAVARVFIVQEKRRLAQRWSIMRGIYGQREQHFLSLMRSSTGNGSAESWLRSQYADTAARLYQQETQDQIQATMQIHSLDLAQPASNPVESAPRATVNAALGAVLALLIALVIAFVATGAYGETVDFQAPRPVLSKVGE